ncbi:MAG: thioredoxin-disulfide reductase [Phycisphaerales bacterium]|nr:MAG: thioredoxin-disulfide reductase [Phycisphaerales bacterium]
MSEDSAEKVVVIGSGPAGWTAAIYAARANLSPLVFEGRPKQSPSLELPGGQLMLTTEVENYPGFSEGVDGPAMMLEFRKQAERFDTRIRTEDIVKVDFSQRPFSLTPDEGEPSKAHAVIVATGAMANWLGLPNEQRLAQSGGGVSACAICDGALPIFRGKVLVVFGGGDSAMEESTYLSKFASKVHVIHRRDQLRASKTMQQRVFDNPKIEIVWDTVGVDILGDDKVTGVRLRNVKTDEERTLDCQGVFMAIGHTPNTAFLEGQLELDKKKYIKLTDPFHTCTSVEGVFAAGDVADSVYRQAVTAAGMGCKAAIDAERWLAAKGVE